MTTNLSALSLVAIDAVKTQQLINDDYERELEAFRAQSGETLSTLLKPLQFLTSYETSFCASVEERRGREADLTIRPLGLSAFARRTLDASRMSRFTVEVVQTPVLRNPFASEKE